MNEKLNVLIIEAADDLRKQIVEGLLAADTHIEIIESPTLLCGCKLISKQEFQAIITDLVLPDPNVSKVEIIEILRQITIMPGKPPTTIVALTDSDVDAVSAISAGADECMEKGKVVTWFGSLNEKIRHCRIRNRERPYEVAMLRLDKLEFFAAKIKEGLNTGCSLDLHKCNAPKDVREECKYAELPRFESPLLTPEQIAAGEERLKERQRLSSEEALKKYG